MGRGRAARSRRSQSGATLRRPARPRREATESYMAGVKHVVARLLTSAAQESTPFAPALSGIVHSERLGLTPETAPFRALRKARAPRASRAVGEARAYAGARTGSGRGGSVSEFGGRVEAHAAIARRRRATPAAAPLKASRSLAEGEDVRLDARIEEYDLEHAVRDRPGLAHQLIEPWLDQRSPAVLVDVEPVGWAGRFAVDEHAERDGRARPRAQDEMEVARMEAESDSPPGFVQHARSLLDRPVPGQGPGVELQRLG